MQKLVKWLQGRARTVPEPEAVACASPNCPFTPFVVIGRPEKAADSGVRTL